MHWTVSINTYEHGAEEVTYSIRMWRVGDYQRTSRNANKSFTGSARVPAEPHPTRALLALLEVLKEQL